MEQSISAILSGEEIFWGEAGYRVFEMNQQTRYWRLTPETRAAVAAVDEAVDRQEDARVIFKLVDKVLKRGQAYRRGYDIDGLCLNPRKKSRNGRAYFVGASIDLRRSQSMYKEKLYYEGKTYLIDKCEIDFATRGPCNNPDFRMYCEGAEVGEKTRERPLTAPWYNQAIMKKRKFSIERPFHGGVVRRRSVFSHPPYCFI